MEKSILNSFTFMFTDKDWLYKLGIFTMLFAAPGFYLAFTLPNTEALKTMGAQSFLPIFMPVIVLSIIVYPFTLGYLAKCTQNVINDSVYEAGYLPNWEDGFFNYFALGIKRILAMLLICLLLIPGSILLCIPWLIYGFITCALDNVFCTNFEIGAYFKWGKAFKIIGANFGLYIQILMVIFFLGLFFALFQLLFSLLKLSSLLVLVLQSLGTVYTSLVAAYLTGLIGENEEDQIPPAYKNVVGA